MSKDKLTLAQILERLDVPQELRDGIEKGEKGLDDFNEHFTSNWINKELSKKDPAFTDSIFGAKMGSLAVETNRLFKDFGLTKEETEKKPFEETLRILKGKIDAKFKEIQDNAGKSDDEKMNKLQKQYDDLKNKHTAAEQDLMKVNKEKEDLSNDFNGRIKSFKLQTVIDGQKSKLKWKDDITEVEREGFDSIMSKKYKLDYDDSGAVVVMDKDGNRMKNAKQTAFMTVDELYESEAINQKLVKMNNATPHNPVTTTAATVPPSNGNPPRKLHPDFIKHVEKLNQ